MMEIKLGQYVRDEVYFGRITKVNEYDGMFKTSRYIDIEEQYLLDHKHNLRKERCNIKIANDPRELIDTKIDLIVKGGRTYPQKVSVYCKNNRGVPTYVAGLGDYIEEDEITKILTPNSNGGYDLQWSADNDKR